MTSVRQLSRLLVLVLAPFGLMGIQCEAPSPGDLPLEPPVERPDEPVSAPVDPQDLPEDEGPEDEGPDDERPDDERPDDEGPDDEPTEIETPAEALVNDLVVDRVSLYQGVEVSLDDSTASLAPVVAGRDALVRAFVEPLPGYVARVMTAVLEIENGDEVTLLEETVRPLERSRKDDLDSTLNFFIDGELLTPATALSVRLLEPADGFSEERGPVGGLWPAGGVPRPLGAVDLGGAVTVRIVPLLYAADGTHRAPDTSAAQVETMRSALLGMTPAPDAILWVDSPVNITTPLAANGDGWSDALVLLTNLRETRNVRSSEYVYGLVAPATAMGAYCGGSCVTGLSWRATDPTAAWARTSLGLGYAGVGAEDTFVHELGHAHGRMHTPCGGPANPDPDYPYADGLLGTQGYDMDSDELIPAESRGDLMGYCSPRWVSDYTYAALAERMAWVHAEPMMIAPPGWPKRMLAIDAGPQPRFVGAMTLQAPLSGATEAVQVLDASGVVLYEVEAEVQAMEHTGRDVLLVPAPARRDAVTVRFAGVELSLPE